MSKKMSAGSGASSHLLDRENRIVGIDFSGIDNGKCFRNDASILFFASNSYRSAFLSLGRDLENRFENNNYKDIEHLILPYLFNFRHFVELELKALYVALTGESPIITHSLNELISNIYDELTNLYYCDIDKGHGVFFKSEKFFKDEKTECLETVKKLKVLIAQYNKEEPSIEYYRYIFENEKINGDRHLVLKNPIIQLDYPKTNQLFCSIRDSFDILCEKLREIIYIYYTL